MQYLVIEHFRDRNPVPVYQRFNARGRMAPEGLRYVGSWITEDLCHCYQVMETDDRRLLEQWMAQWADLMEFEVMPVLSSAEVKARLGAAREGA